MLFIKITWRWLWSYLVICLRKTKGIICLDAKSMDMNLSNLWEIVGGRGAWGASVHGVTKSQTQLSDWATVAWGLSVICPALPDLRTNQSVCIPVCPVGAGEGWRKKKGWNDTWFWARLRTSVGMDVAGLDAALSCSVLPPIKMEAKLSGYFTTQERT